MRVLEAIVAGCKGSYWSVGTLKLLLLESALRYIVHNISEFRAQCPSKAEYHRDGTRQYADDPNAVLKASSEFDIGNMLCCSRQLCAVLLLLLRW